MHAVHGIGTALGLQLSDDLDSIMHPTLDYRPELENGIDDLRAVLSDQDVENIRWLYGENSYLDKQYCFQPIVDSRIKLKEPSLVEKIKKIDPLYLILIGIIVMMIVFMRGSIQKKLDHRYRNFRV